MTNDLTQTRYENNNQNHIQTFSLSLSLSHEVMSDAVTVVLEHLQAENQQLSEELLKQFEIATSLKQLVVAATGGDLQQRIVEMERENIELRQELGRLCEQLPQLAAQTRSALRRERQQSTGIVAALLRAIDAADESSMKEGTPCFIMHTALWMNWLLLCSEKERR